MPKYEDEGIVEDNDDLETEEGGKKKGKGTTAIIAAFIVVIWIAIFALLVKLDVGGFGSSVLYPVLKDVPVLNKIAGEPIDVLVNGKYVAKGEVVVIEESFGVKITEIVK